MTRTMARRASRIAPAAAATLTLVAALASTAGATAPGRNGELAFRRYFDTQQSWGAVFTARADGTGARQVTHPAPGVVDDQPDWAPNGSLISFTRCDPNDNGRCHVWVVAPDGTGLAPVGPLCEGGSDVTTCADEANSSFSPDSRQIAFTQATGQVKPDPKVGDIIEHSALTIMNVDGSGRKVVYQGAPFSADLNYPVFSPDGKRLVFERQTSGFSKPAGKRAVYVVGVDGSGLRRLTPWAENDGDNPDWSPNGRWIVFHSHVDDPSAQSQFFLMHPDGSGRKQITRFAPGTHVASASFSPDGSSIVFSKGPEGGNIDVFTIRLDGSHERRITRSTLWDSAPDWGPLS
jgi:TolB protein